jgi:hypothetical protein
VGDRAKRLIKLFDGQISSDVRQDGAAVPSVGGWDGGPRGRLEDQQTIQMERLR